MRILARVNFLQAPASLLRDAQKKATQLPQDLTSWAMRSPDRLRRTMNLWPPLAGSGIRITHFSDDWRSARIEINLSTWNANMHGVVFGGTLYAITDFLFGMVISRVLGKDFQVLTRAGSFQYLTPGRDGAYMEVEFSHEMEKWVRETIAEDGYCNVPYTCVIKNKDGSVVGIGQQSLHARPRGGGKRTAAPQQALKANGMVLESLATALIWHVFKDKPEISTVLMSEQRRIPEPADQMRHVVQRVREETDLSREDLLALDVPEEFLPAN